MKAVHPYLNFSGNTEEAFAFYQSVFGGEVFGVMRFRDFPDNAMNVPEGDLDKIAHIALPLGQGTVLMGTDALSSLGQTLRMGNNAYIYLEADSAEEAQGLFSALAEGGHTEMPLQRVEWAERYGVCTDKFGVQWMVGYTGDAGQAAAQ
ncbi:VOC family protein [Truepera radiovictrix]|uniref:Glyoxalase/bleomycin resistance protein/dioxygenase n=1 Tax=Truepera radiovictrix (strain DSM 17093 / CIP 108686 / LMG 22925 / RQ-24) TaxID=649638 RepID=D7CUV3_TRURR|nr:VOC family protein [Truepera radiovictrix]ADI14094.1 Glyoxalase/bleomycin resistance protein/dioxygenase [Truepera radiovictrix DSM 17093]WMT57344.1 VOC family protein [Truepera radiovictrix]